MMNPETHAPMITPRQMYSYDRKTNQTWNMRQYKTPRIYQDPKLQIQKRQWAVQEKGKKSDKYITKKGFYMDYQMKVAKSIPASSKHGSNQPWTFPKAKKLSQHLKVDPSLTKNTYIQQIQTEQKNRKKPGICTYSLEKSYKQKQKMIQKLKRTVAKEGEKRFFYENTQTLSNDIPGSGNYHPHDTITKIKKERHDYRYWVDKHKKENDIIKKRQMKKPTANTYRPFNQSFRSFELTQRTIDLSPKKSIEKKNWFGSDSKFEYTRPSKKKIKEIRPSPASYSTIISWRSKGEKRNSKDWSQALWKGKKNYSSIYN